MIRKCDKCKTELDDKEELWSIRLSILKERKPYNVTVPQYTPLPMIKNCQEPYQMCTKCCKDTGVVFVPKNSEEISISNKEASLGELIDDILSDKIYQIVDETLSGE